MLPSAPGGGLELAASVINPIGVLEFEGQRAHPPSKPFGGTFQRLFIKLTHEINPMDWGNTPSGVPGYEAAVNSTYFQQAGARTAMHHSDLHSREHVFPLCAFAVFSGARQRRLHGGGPASAERSTLTLTFQHATLHKAADNHTVAPQTHYMPQAWHGAPTRRAPVGCKRGRRLSHWQEVTNNCSSTDMLNGPTANLPDWCVVLRQGAVSLAGVAAGGNLGKPKQTKQQNLMLLNHCLWSVTIWLIIPLHFSLLVCFSICLRTNDKGNAIKHIFLTLTENFVKNWANNNINKGLDIDGGKTTAYLL